MLQRIFAIFQARNREFLRDRGTLAWNVLLPILLVAAFAFAFSGDGRDAYTIAVLQSDAELDEDAHPFLDSRFMRFVVVDDLDNATHKVGRHQFDLLVEFSEPGRYWVNEDSPKGYFAEKLLLQSAIDGPLQRNVVEGSAVRYVDWVLPGILGMNMMFSCLFGVGYVVVRYRKNGFLKRLRATPLRPIEFIVAQVSSRMVLITAITVFIYTSTHLILDTRMEGSYFSLFIVAVLGAISLVSLGLLVAARVTSEELAGGLLNMINWPMMLLSGVWFSLEGAGEVLQNAARLFPLTHMLDAARAIMLDGAGLLDVWPNLAALLLMTALFLGLGALFFRWHPN